MSEYALEINGLKKVYDNGVEALKGIDLKITKGDFFALLGPNGAGKSSTIGIISSITNKTDENIKKMLILLVFLKEKIHKKELNSYLFRSK